MEFDQEVAQLAQNKLPSKIDNPCVFYGSSSFRLWESLDKDIPELDCLNLAFGGSQISDCLYYFDKLIGQTEPSRIFFYAGDNDIATEIAPEAIFERFQKLFEKIQTQFTSVPFAYLSIKPSPIRENLLGNIQQTNALIANFLKDKKGADFIDIHTPMLNQGRPRPELFTEDELHMNASGYAIWAEAIRDYLKK
ncbi:GDSL-type esterase/lipase family protein [Marinilongibacter aquaticus]|uniref:GDSL-type esterase/lipase family protein n=1 Tax=Marinilongibacter aquaticus TaxID=2975157 RepID=UPI0021BDE621|nr:GDSL-type esterase/lipase family protein [Marinilongibacter aquaticus]UBM57447.1 GDSL-type esterase/lipase family protein [Marinilongibacter aquaticus]